MEAVLFVSIPSAFGWYFAAHDMTLRKNWSHVIGGYVLTVMYVYYLFVHLSEVALRVYPELVILTCMIGALGYPVFFWAACVVVRFFRR